MKICEYGCGRKAKFPPRKGQRKWCCVENFRGCPSFIERANKNKIPWNKGKQKIYSKEALEKMSEAKKGKILPKEHRKKIGEAQKLTISKIKEKYPFFSQIEEIRYNPDKPKEKEMQVHCKNNNCPNSKEKGGWFTPTFRQIQDRRNYLVNEGDDKSYFYCSQKCKDSCLLYGLKSDPFQETKKSYTQEEYNTWKLEVLKKQKKRDIYNFCEKCYSVKNLHVHHEKPVKTHPHLALDPDNGIVLCKNCHYKYGHKTGTECSTGALANEFLIDCKLGGQEK